MCGSRTCWLVGGGTVREALLEINIHVAVLMKKSCYTQRGNRLEIVGHVAVVMKKSCCTKGDRLESRVIHELKLFEMFATSLIIKRPAPDVFIQDPRLAPEHRAQLHCDVRCMAT